MDYRPLGARIFALNAFRRIRMQKKTLGFALHHGQLPLLEQILANPDCTQQEIAAALKVTPASVAQSAARLEKAGLIEKTADPENRRRNRLSVTDAGKRATDEYRRCFNEVDRETFAGFTEAELLTLSAYLDRMIQNINDGGTDVCPFPHGKGKLPK